MKIFRVSDGIGWYQCHKVPVGDFRPIRVLKDTDDDLYYEYVPKDRPG